jgi:hypothetical protein
MQLGDAKAVLHHPHVLELRGDVARVGSNRGAIQRDGAVVVELRYTLDGGDAQPYRLASARLMRRSGKNGRRNK